MKKVVSVLILSAFVSVPAFAHRSGGMGNMNEGFMQMDKTLDRADEAKAPDVRRDLMRERSR